MLTLSTMIKFPKRTKPEVSTNMARGTLRSQQKGETALTSQFSTLVLQLLASPAPGLQCAGTLLVESLLFLSEAQNLLQICRNSRWSTKPIAQFNYSCSERMTYLFSPDPCWLVVS